MMVLRWENYSVVPLLLMVSSLGLSVAAQPVCAQGGTATAPAPAAEFSLREGEILLEGKLSSATPAQKTFVLTASSFTLPNGKTSSLAPAKPKTVVIDAATTLHVRGNATQKVELDLVLPGVFMIVVGKDAGSGQALTARQVAVWDKVAAGKFSLSASALVQGQTSTATGTASTTTASEPTGPASTLPQPSTQPTGIQVAQAELASGASELSLEAARLYMLQLINRDRASQGLGPVALDPIATAAGQKHAEEMAMQRYQAHWNMEGKKPDQRYTEAGGVDFSGENSHYMWQGSGPERQPLIPNARFKKQELEKIESDYFNEAPPNDSHRVTILDPYQTHVGIGLAVAGSNRMRTVANKQVFVRRYLEDVAPLPLAAQVGEQITISGRPVKGYDFWAIGIGREELPRPTSVPQLRQTGGYNRPQAHQWLFPIAPNREGTVKVEADGRFRITTPIAADGQAGMYYVFIWAIKQGMEKVPGNSFVASARTIAVEASSDAGF
ncbi:MAG TPA: CAP domain-containing protein [Abditibacteriaceae bacterium]